jgi:hypothetical protein
LGSPSDDTDTHSTPVGPKDPFGVCVHEAKADAQTTHIERASLFLLAMGLMALPKNHWECDAYYKGVTEL